LSHRGTAAGTRAVSTAGGGKYYRSQRRVRKSVFCHCEARKAEAIQGNA
jgi:hypothetical protein